MHSARAARPVPRPRPAPRDAQGPARGYIARQVGHDMAQAIEAHSFMEAALLFAERIADGDAGTVEIMVSDAETGASERFTLSLG